jgi:hypothetical protein
MPEHAQLPGLHLGLDARVVRCEALDHPVDAQVLVIARHDLVRAPFAGIEQHEVFDDVEQTGLVQHALEQDGQQGLVLARLRIVLVEPLPAVEVLAGAGQRPILRIVAVGDHHQRVPVEQVRDGVEVVAVVLLVGAVDMHLEALELDEHQRQPLT